MKVMTRIAAASNSLLNAILPVALVLMCIGLCLLVARCETRPLTPQVPVLFSYSFKATNTLWLEPHFSALWPPP